MTVNELYLDLNTSGSVLNSIEVQYAIFINNCSILKIEGLFSCQYLSIVWSTIESLINAKVSQDLVIHNSTVAFLPEPLVLHSSSLANVGNTKLPEYGLVFGDMLVPAGLEVPKNFFMLRGTYRTGV